MGYKRPEMFLVYALDEISYQISSFQSSIFRSGRFMGSGGGERDFEY
jgi:hypothetical protein